MDDEAIERVARAIMEHEIQRHGWSDWFAENMRKDADWLALNRSIARVAIAALETPFTQGDMT